MFPAERAPDQIGSYRIVRRLAGQPPVEVFLAREEGPRGFQRDCVLKVMPDVSEGDAAFSQDLAREAAICARMNHPAIVRVIELFERDKKLILVLEHAEGTTLEQLLQHLADKGQKVPDGAAFYIVHRVASAIAHAHAAADEHGVATPIIHRNLTPENVLIGVDGEVRLTGFGVGKIVGRTPESAIGSVKGTPGFMAPEQARGEPVTQKADVFGLGLLLWTMLSGFRPPTDGTWPKKITTLRTDLPKEVIAILDAALDPFPGTRKIGAREIEQWLSKASGASKGRAELKDRVAAMLSGAAAEAPLPAAPAAKNAEPFKGAQFGPLGSASRGTAAKRSAPREEPPAALSPPPPRARLETLQGIEPSTMSAARAIQAASSPALNIQPSPPPPAVIRFGEPPAQPAQPAPPAHHEPTPAPMGVVPAVVTFGAPPPSQPSINAAPVTPQAPAVTPAQQPAPQPPAQPQPAGRPAPAMPAMTMPPPKSLKELRKEARDTLPFITRGRRSLTLTGTIAVSAGTATAVALVLIYVFSRGDSTKGASPGASARASASASAALKPPPPPSTPPPATTPPPPASALAPNPNDLPYGYGYLIVTAKRDANVYVSGKFAGPVNQALKVKCGRFFVRLASPREGRYPEWVSGGETVLVGCQEVTRIDISP